MPDIILVAQEQDVGLAALQRVGKVADITEVAWGPGDLDPDAQRLRAHDVFTSVCVPDLFMEAVERRADWYLFAPHEVKSAKGWYRQDCYEEKRGSGSFRDRYAELVADERISRRTVKAIDLFKRIMLSQLETGNPT
ncbi:hypothetical protein G6F59_015465 [Rhizopus arrhizus]|nr:hypothetical protein G6F59_015465 [Rhizopus arrhizus]